MKDERSHRCGRERANESMGRYCNPSTPAKALPGGLLVPGNKPFHGYANPDFATNDDPFTRWGTNEAEPSPPRQATAAVAERPIKEP